MHTDVVRTFVRDVAVNVAGSLIAAAVIYLVAVVSGYVLARTVATFLAAEVLAAGAAALLAWLGTWLGDLADDHDSMLLWWAKVITYASAGIVFFAPEIALVFVL